MKVVIAIDSFKGSMSSFDLSEKINAGIKAIYSNAEVVTIPVADGGEGTVNSLVLGTDGEFIKTAVYNPIMQPITAQYGILGDKKTAVIEMAAASGLPLIQPDEYNPEKTTTFGTGQLIRDAIDRGCRKFIIGLGGSATNDAGIGMLKALGFKFYDRNRKEVHGCGGDLINIIDIDCSSVMTELANCKFTVACDVDNPFHGANGAAHIYSRQKGANDDMVIRLDDGLKSFAHLIKMRLNKDISNLHGAGAAGGLGGSFVAFLNAILNPGVDIILDAVNFDKKVVNADFVITGEGKLDGQSIHGKTPIGIAHRAKRHKIPVIALAGSITDDATVSHNHGISALFSITNGPITLQEAMNYDNCAKLVEFNTREIFRLIKVIKEN